MRTGWTKAIQVRGDKNKHGGVSVVHPVEGEKSGWAGKGSHLRDRERRLGWNSLNFMSALSGIPVAKCGKCSSVNVRGGRSSFQPHPEIVALVLTIGLQKKKCAKRRFVSSSPSLSLVAKCAHARTRARTHEGKRELTGKELVVTGWPTSGGGRQVLRGEGAERHQLGHRQSVAAGSHVVMQESPLVLETRAC